VLASRRNVGQANAGGKLRFVLSILIGMSLLIQYLYFLNFFFAPILLVSPMNPLEQIVFYTLTLRAIGLILIPRLRRLHPQLKIAIFSLETFILVIFIFLYIYTGYSFFEIMMGNLLTAWIASSLIVLTPYGIYQLVAMMYKNAVTTTLTNVFSSLVPELGITLFLSNLAASVSSPPIGLTNFGSFVINSIKTQPGLGNSSALSSNPLIQAATIMIYISLLVYIAVCQNPLASFGARYHFALLPMLLGTIALSAWLYIATSFSSNILFVLSVPSVITSIILWVIYHGKKK